jgi:predicted GIY-YIG superfamily endonuclease
LAAPNDPIKYVCLLRSQSDPDQSCIGLTANLKVRLAKHNEGGSPHIANFKPWNLVTYPAFSEREQAAAFEACLKTRSGRAFAAKRLWWFSAGPQLSEP